MISKDATRRIEIAIGELKQVLTTNDAATFEDTTFQDVWRSVEVLQKVQSQSGSVQNIQHIEPFLKALQNYSAVLETTCDDTLYLSWLWVSFHMPLKNAPANPTQGSHQVDASGIHVHVTQQNPADLQLAADDENAFETLIDAYKQIGESMPQFRGITDSYHSGENFQAVMSLTYKDILEFHRATYELFRQQAWHLLFDSLWKDFQFRFNGILKKLAQQRKLLIKPTFINLLEAEESRSRHEEYVRRQEKIE